MGQVEQHAAGASMKVSREGMARRHGRIPWPWRASGGLDNGKDGAGNGRRGGELGVEHGAGLWRQEQGAWCGDGRGAALRLRDLALSGVGRSRTQQWGDERAAGLGCSWRTGGVEAPGTWRGGPRGRRGGGEMARRRPHRSGEGGGTGGRRRRGRGLARARSGSGGLRRRAGQELDRWHAGIGRGARLAALAPPLPSTLRGET